MYEEFYNSLVKLENSFNIELVIYLLRRFFFVCVFVNLYGFNEVENFIVLYIWSFFCLYVVVLLFMLEVLFFGFIFVMFWI